MGSEPLLPPERLEGLLWRRAQLGHESEGLEEIPAADLVIGDRLCWGGELLTVNDVRPTPSDRVEIYGQHEGWTFPLEFHPFEAVHVALPRPGNVPAPLQGAPA